MPSLPCAERVAAEIEQVWKNCAKFNEPGSEVAQLGLTARGVLQELWSSEGLPIGVCMTGRFGDEATLFRLAAQLEQTARLLTAHTCFASCASRCQ